MDSGPGACGESTAQNGVSASQKSKLAVRSRSAAVGRPLYIARRGFLRTQCRSRHHQRASLRRKPTSEFMSLVRRGPSLNEVREASTRLGPTHHRLREEARAEVCHIAHRVCHAQGSRCVCECDLETPNECSCMSTARDRRAGMRAEAYRSMAYERGGHGQLCHVQAAVCQVLVDGDPPCRRHRNAFWHSSLGSLGPSYRRGVNKSKSQKMQKASTWRHW